MHFELRYHIITEVFVVILEGNEHSRLSCITINLMLNMCKTIQEGGKVQMKRKQEGITLIALIITIIVMLVLVAVSINILIKSNLIGTAEKATGKYKTATEEEGNLNGIKVNGKDLDNYIPLTVIEAGERASEKSSYKGIIIPAGFTVSGIPAEQNIDDGLVIYDIPEGKEVNWEDTDSVQTQYNQFVYVPTGNFYVGRYEVGCEEERTDTTVDLSTPLLQRDLYPYNYVTYEEAISLCKSMYPGLNISLCSIEELQEIDEFMSDKTGINKVAQSPYSGSGSYSQLGNNPGIGFTVKRGKVAVWNSTGNENSWVYSPYYQESPYTVGTSRMYFEVNETRTYQKEQGKIALLSTGAVDEFSINNIFDLYGNLNEYIVTNNSECIGFFRSSYEWDWRISKGNEFDLW